VNYANGQRRVASLRREIAKLRSTLRETLARIEPQPVDDHVFAVGRRRVHLLALFRDHEDLIVIHNMGRRCAYCTLWADGYNGVYTYLASRAAFVVLSPDSPAEQRQFARSRAWRFPMASDEGSRFAKRMGYVDASGRCLPGISTFRREGESIFRVADTASRPHDDFCGVWHLFDLLAGGVKGWQPRIESIRSAKAKARA
jgi:predicted dithiol-disulfide oxidoreductase (DUF899 family)